MAALAGLLVLSVAGLSIYFGVTPSPLRWQGLISRELDPSSFRKAVGVHIVIGLLFIIGWFVNVEWHVFQ